MIWKPGVLLIALVLPVACGAATSPPASVPQTQPDSQPTTTASGASDIVAPPALALVALIVVVVVAIVLVIAVVGGLILLAVVLATTFFGVVLSSTLAGVIARRRSVGWRLFVAQIGALSGAGLGSAAIWFENRSLQLHLPQASIVGGALLGGLVGAACGLVLAIALERLVRRWLPHDRPSRGFDVEISP